MRTIVLTRLDSYKPRRLNPDNIEFFKDVPVTVPDDLADMCLETGQFMDAAYSPVGDSIADGMGIQRLVVGKNYVLNPKNTLDDDDLNGQRIMFRRNGGIGDMVFLAVIAQYVKDKYPKCQLWAGLNDDACEFASCFSVFDRIFPLKDALRDEVIHACNYIVEFNGVLGAEASNSEDNMDYFEEHWKRAGLSLPVPSPLPVPDISGLIGNLSANAKTTETLKKNGLSDDGYAVLLLGTSNPLKRLTVEQLKTIANTYISAAKDGPAQKIICLAGKGDRYFDSEHPHIRVEAELPLLVSADLVRRASVIIGADTGLMQLAGVLGIPTVSIWGPTDPALSFSHYAGPQVKLTQEGKLDCAPCRRIRTAFCPYYESGYTKCMKSFDPLEIAHFASDLAREHPTHELQSKGPDDVQSDREQKQTAYRVAILLDNGGYYTGGGYYAWSLAKILAEKPRVEVTVITDVDVTSGFVYARGDVLPRGNKLKVQFFRGDMDRWDDQDYYDLVIGTPPFLGGAAVEYAKKRGSKTALLVYETPNYISQYRDGIDGAEDYWAPYKEALKNADAIWTISREVNKHLVEWIPEINDKTWVVKPTVNTAVADTVFNGKNIRARGGMNMVMISRNVKYKQLADTIKVIATRVAPLLPIRPTLHVIGHKVTTLDPTTSAYTKNCDVVFHENLPDVDKWNLLFSARAVIHPSEFEGFGIPIAEGLYAGATVFAHPLPVFKDEFQDAPVYYTDEKELADGLVLCMEHWHTEVELPRATARRQFAAKRFSRHSQSQAISRCLHTSLGFTDMRVQPEEEENTKVGNEVRVAIIGPWNTQCGIADTTKDVVDNISATYRVFSYSDIPTVRMDEDYVVRCWDRSFSNPNTLLHYLNEFDPNVVHIHHEHSLFQNEENFFTFLRELKRMGMQVIVTLHTYRVDAFTDRLMETVDVVTTTKPQEGMDSSFTDVPLPVVYVPSTDRMVARNKYGLRHDDFVVGTFGMWQEHKGFREFMDSYDDLKSVVGDNVRYVISGASPPKSQYTMECRRKHIDKIKGGLFLFFEDYPPIEEVVERLSTCDALVFDYSVAHWSSASAAIRTAMMAKVPIICSESPMFTEFIQGKHVLKVPFGDNQALIQALLTLRNDPALGEKLVENCQSYCDTCSPERVARRWDRIYASCVYGEEED